ncbi:unnamed protein product [Owenia fusiformis]|uniref:Uncharacterized protein n=1 Tax=Owenia fusiformis TaxID=6347 RepID=A0A8J1XGI8_OWEFU|nr:unnamed protein product [Owenia fusiformis]
MLNRILLAACIVVSAYGFAVEKVDRCYDCNYAPTGFTKHVTFWKAVGANAGFSKCSLTQEEDGDFLDKWACQSGRCFIRRDPNGLVYRGCADEKKLPWGIDVTTNCEYQGYGESKALWFFCNGDLCNTGALGDLDRCGVPPPPKPYNPCAKKDACANNPSGLFDDITRDNHFIQCGCDSDSEGNTCACCKPFYFKCPYNTDFDDKTKVCSLPAVHEIPTTLPATTEEAKPVEPAKPNKPDESVKEAETYG